MSGHPFKAWLLANHVGENTPLGDLAGEVRLDPTFLAKGTRRDLLRYFEEVWGASGAFIDCFEAAWQLYEAVHPFVSWLRQQDNAVFATFAADYGDLLPATGGREALRAVVENDDRELDANKFDGLSVFDVAWREFRPTCTTPGCKLAVDDRMDLCAVHVLAELL